MLVLLLLDLLIGRLERFALFAFGLLCDFVKQLPIQVVFRLGQCCRADTTVENDLAIRSATGEIG